MRVEPPEELRRRYAGTWTTAWDLVPFATTWRLDREDEASLYVKVCALPPHRDERPLFRDEAERMRWARAAGLPVPQLVDVGEDGAVDWIVSEALPGERAEVHPRRRSDPIGVAAELARAARQLHEVPPDSCPFDRTLDVALAARRRRLGEGVLAVDTMHLEHRSLTPASGLRRLEERRPADEDVVVCHRDLNEANVLLDERGRLSGIVDVGLLALGDRWCDLAVTSWYLEGNHGPDAADAFFAAYGVEPDPDRMAYYRLLYSVA